MARATRLSDPPAVPRGRRFLPVSLAPPESAALRNEGRFGSVTHHSHPDMKLDRRFLRALGLPLVVVVLSLAATAADTPVAPSAAQIFDRYVEALGGRAALEKIKSRVMKGKIELSLMPGLSAPFEVQAKAPNKEVSGFELGGFGAIREGYDGKVAWSLAPFQGVKEKTGAELARVQRTKLFPRELRMREGYTRWEAKGAAKVDTVDAWVIEAAPKEGKPDHLYFDQKSGLLLREESIIEGPAGEMTFQVDFGDYRAVDGVKLPFRMKVPKPVEVALEIRFDEVKQNVEIADTAFEKPKG